MALFIRFAQWWIGRKFRQGIVMAHNLKLLQYIGIPCDDGSVEWFTQMQIESLENAKKDARQGNAIPFEIKEARH